MRLFSWQLVHSGWLLFVGVAQFLQGYVKHLGACREETVIVLQTMRAKSI